jgi:hypothetical protein
LRHPLYNLLFDLPRLLKKRAMHVQIIALPARSDGRARREVALVRLGGARGLTEYDNRLVFVKVLRGGA